MARLRRCTGALLFLLLAVQVTYAQAPVAYRLSFPEREHRILDVEVTFRDVPAGTLELRMSRSSPGRYAAHEFAKNVFSVRITDADGKPLAVARPNPHQWDVTGHGGTVRVTYRVFGDRVDGTYLAVDSTHAHINMPAALMWARGLETRPATVRFEPPPGQGWRVATQLLTGTDPNTFSSPNLQYLMDSPTEVSAFAQRTFTVPEEARTPVFRIALHHTGTDAELDAFARDVESIVRETRHVFGEYPQFEGNTYTFIADYLPWANGDGMEHRNSTIITSSGSLRSNRGDLLDTVAHEFFHAWNVERIRPRSLEPFSFEDANISSELWFAEGVTNYYGPLVTRRAGLTTVRQFAEEMGRAIDTVITSPGRLLRTAEEMSQHAPFVDAATAIDRTNFDNTFISYYTWGEAIGLALDLSLRDRSDNKRSLDDVMRIMWERHGRPGTAAGSVANPYTAADLEKAVAEVAGDAAFARDFFARYVQGHEVADYARLAARAGFVLRPVAAGRAWAGELSLQDSQGGVRVTAAVPFGSPAYAAGLERDDTILSVGGTRVATRADVERLVAARKPGEALPITFDRRGQQVTGTLKLVEDPRRELLPAEDAGQPLTDAQRRFRDAWLSSAARNVF